MFCKKGVLRNSAKFTGKHLWQSLFFNKKEFFLLKKSLWYEFCEISKNTFFTEHLRTAASEDYVCFEAILMILSRCAFASHDIFILVKKTSSMLHIKMKLNFSVLFRRLNSDEYFFKISINWKKNRLQHVSKLGAETLRISEY